jgi:dTDP-6-deoxy-L-talose 4-dehydrogenase (NAD+)
MREGLLSEDMPAAPANAYARAKDDLRKYVTALQAETAFHFKWVRLFYMYGQGQNQKSLLSQLDKALENGDVVFNMSGGEQERDYLPVEQVAAYIVQIALQNKTEGIINCCSGRPVTVKAFVEDYLRKKNRQITLNLGYYPYPDYEAMRFWGDNKKLQQITR